MKKFAYSPDTGELIVTESPADWMATTALVPPVFDASTAGCFLREGAWVIVAGEVPNPNEAIFAQIATLEAKITDRRKREAILLMEGAMEWLKAQDMKIAALRAGLV